MPSCSTGRSDVPVLLALITDFLDHLRLERALSEHTLRAYRGDVLKFHAFASEYLGKEPRGLLPGDVDTQCVRAFIVDLNRQGLGRKSQGRALSAVRYITWSAP